MTRLRTQRVLETKDARAHPDVHHFGRAAFCRVIAKGNSALNGADHHRQSARALAASVSKETGRENTAQ
jgi:hypothetical protein